MFTYMFFSIGFESRGGMEMGRKLVGSLKSLVWAEESDLLFFFAFFFFLG